VNGEELCCKKTMCKWLRHIPCGMPLAFRIAHHWLAREAKPHAEVLSKSAGKPEAYRKGSGEAARLSFCCKANPNETQCCFV